ncbi:hypothetical protein [Corynebacterium sp. A21]|uniref:hypothetical protein n=1 Tax=Corynebacterium sp. A21 TaxID=3457318 RepID=UPI003FD2708D
MWHEIAWTDDSEQHIARHDVTPAEVHEVLQGDPKLYRQGRGNTTLVFGITDSGRHLLVVLADSLDGRDYVVTAREMTSGEKKNFKDKGK